MTATLTTPADATAAPASGVEWVCADGNEAAASVAHRLSDVCALYPITPSSPMGELADLWSNKGRTNIWGQVPRTIQMQSEGGAIGTLHGAVQAGSLATSFTSSQGLLLMLPNMFKIAGELTPAVLHVAARAIATHALSIFGDHSDVMAARGTGWGMLASNGVQEAHDLAAIAHAASLKSRIPFIHFFDGFRTSHEVNRMRMLSDDDLRALVDEADVLAHRARAMTPSKPVLRGTAQNPDVFFQAREAGNPFYDAAPGIVADAMDRFAKLTGRRYGLVEYHGSPTADRVIVSMGSSISTIRSTVDALNAAALETDGGQVGVLAVRLFRPFPAEALVAALPPSVTAVAVLDRCKEPGASAEPLHLEVVTALAEFHPNPPKVIGGRYGLGSKEFTPRDVAAVFAELANLNAGAPAKRRFTVGITDDVTHLSLPTDPAFTLPAKAVEAVFYGLGADGTVGANKASVKLIGENTESWVQGYFVYDSKKSGSTTISHLRFGPEPVDAPYLIEQADFVGIHQFSLMGKLPMLEVAKPGATVLIATMHRPDQVWAKLPADAQRAIIDKNLSVWVINAGKIARRAGLGGRINTVMQACFFALAKVLPVDEALKLIKDSARKTYGKRGEEIVQANLDAIDAALAGMSQMVVPAEAAEAAVSCCGGGGACGEADDAAEFEVETRESGCCGGSGQCGEGAAEPTPASALDTVRRLILGEGEMLPVSAMPVDGTFPTGTAALEKRGNAVQLPTWEPANCIDCGKCAIACPHAAIRLKTYDADYADLAPSDFLSKDVSDKNLPKGSMVTIQVSPDDCTGCSICTTVCPASALTLMPASTVRDSQRRALDYFQTIPETRRSAVRTDTVSGSQALQPLFEFSGACDGCGQTPYVKLVSQLLGDRMLVANATGCSSIYGGNLPTTPWTTNAAGQGPAWNNSLFEDNAEFGMGLKVGALEREAHARALLGRLAGDLDLPEGVLDGLLSTIAVTDEKAIAQQRKRVTTLLEALDSALQTVDPASALAADAAALKGIADALLPVSVWVIGGDGWAYDIGYGGLDHLLASGQDINVLVLDSEVYSNTGGQASKATPLGASAKFAAGGKGSRKKDLGLLAQAYRDVYVAQISLGANDEQTVKALSEAAAYPGPSLVIAYATCREQGIDLTSGVDHQRAAVASGHWPLYRYHPEPTEGAEPVLTLDSEAPSMPLAAFYATETRYQAVSRADPERGAELLTKAQAHVDERWALYQRLAEN
jgi:pyruvate-ferredoxin/flavodoxin oxidoreductase